VIQPNGCVYWTRAHANGRPVIQVNGKLCKVTRVLWPLVRGGDELPQVLRHTCHDPKCIKVLPLGEDGHLIPGTFASNGMDKAIAGRANTPKGEDHGKAKLTQQQVRAIRKRYAAGGITQRRLGDQYGISQGQIGRIVRGERWTER